MPKSTFWKTLSTRNERPSTLGETLWSSKKTLCTLSEASRLTNEQLGLRHRHQRAKAAGNSHSLDLKPTRPPPTLPLSGDVMA